MRAQDPEITQCRDGWSSSGAQVIGGVVARRGLLHPLDEQVDLAHLEAGDLQAEVQLLEGEVPERLSQEAFIPGRVLGQLIVGDHERLGLSLGQVLQTDGGHLGPTQEGGGLNAPMAGDDPLLAVHQYGGVEAEGLNALGDLADLLPGVNPRVVRIQLEGTDRQILDFEPSVPGLKRLCRRRHAGLPPPIRGVGSAWCR